MNTRAHSVKYGASYPDFAVRGLNGLVLQAAASHTEAVRTGWSSDLEAAPSLDASHLEAAQHVLRAFDRVLILENGQLNAFFGDQGVAISNNPYSSRRDVKLKDVKWRARAKNIPANVQAALAPPPEFVATWRKQNALDIKLYDWAVQCSDQSADRTKWKR